MKDWQKHKKSMIKELIKLEEIGFSDEASEQVFPYVIIETLNILKNSEFVKNPVDLTKTGDDAKELLKTLKKE